MIHAVFTTDSRARAHHTASAHEEDGMADLTTSVWDLSARDFPTDAPLEARLRFLLRYAILAPSVKNTQPWSFAVDGRTVRVYADRGRALTVTDPDRRELYISVGCALENLLVAAEHFGMAHEVRYVPEGDDAELAATVAFWSGGVRSPERQAIPLDALIQRQNDNSLYRDAPVSLDLRRRLHECVAEPDLQLELSEDGFFRSWVDDLTFEADRAEFASAAFRRELGESIGHGLFSAPGIKARLAGLLVSHVDIGEAVANQDRELVASAALLGLVLGEQDTHAVHLRTGQLFERVWLTATALGVSIHPMSQTMRTPQLREVVADLVGGYGWMPQHLFRVGFSARETRPRHTPRRPLEEVLRG
jgi:nitroreductase